jgi:hypothetical protein
MKKFLLVVAAVVAMTLASCVTKPDTPVTPTPAESAVAKLNVLSSPEDVFRAVSIDAGEAVTPATMEIFFGVAWEPKSAQRAFYAFNTASGGKCYTLNMTIDGIPELKLEDSKWGEVVPTTLSPMMTLEDALAYAKTNPDVADKAVINLRYCHVLANYRAGEMVEPCWQFYVDNGVGGYAMVGQVLAYSSAWIP